MQQKEALNFLFLQVVRTERGVLKSYISDRPKANHSFWLAYQLCTTQMYKHKESAVQFQKDPRTYLVWVQI